MKRQPQATSAAARKLADIEAVFSALAHPSRRHILLVIHYRGGSMTAGEIADRFACSWPTTTRHLRTLEGAGLVCMEKKGRERIYRVDRARVREVVGAWLKPFQEEE